MATSMELCTLFGQAVGRVLNSWTVLQLAVEQGFGGIDSKEKAEWMVHAIETWFGENAGIEPYELEEFLADVLNAEFDTIVEDGSLPQIASMICGFYKLYRDDKKAEIHEKMSKLPRSNIQNCLRGSDEQDSCQENNDETAQSTSKSDLASPSTSAAVQPTESNSQEDSSLSKQETQAQSHVKEDDMDVDEEGWQVVHRGRRK